MAIVGAMLLGGSGKRTVAVDSGRSSSPPPTPAERSWLTGVLALFPGAAIMQPDPEVLRRRGKEPQLREVVATGSPIAAAKARWILKRLEEVANG